MVKIMGEVRASGALRQLLKVFCVKSETAPGRPP